ncbi:MAG: dTDP-4-dehydrorhamnose reductase [Gemmatimonadaceae bacterium]|nr:dTDP-4-dehydrorhamnose reductase [Gemmatimonadaceae bacterium]
MTGPVLVTGAAGQLGAELCRTVPEGVRLVAVDIAELDVTDADAVEACVGACRPSLVINAAAFTAVDRAEAEPELAAAVNAGAARLLARAAAHHGARMIQVSTDYVFSGAAAGPWRPSDLPAPASVYGQTKRDGELAVLGALGGQALVIRTAWLHSAHGANFVKTMLRLMAGRDVVRVVSDQVGTPTWARELAVTIWAAAAVPSLAGVLHWTDAGVASWYDLAVAVQEEALVRGLLRHAVPVRPIATADYPTPAARPAYSVLDTTATTAALHRAPQHWRTNLRTMLDELSHA